MNGPQPDPVGILSDPSHDDARDPDDTALSDEPGARLDPADADAFRATAHRVLDACLDRFEHARELPWQAPPDRLPGHLKGLPAPPPRAPSSLDRLADDLIDGVMPYATGNTHPRFFGWVHGTGLSSGLLAELVAATMNSNAGGRRHIAIDIERQVIDWCASLHGLPEGAGGLIASGTSLATVYALQAARVDRLGNEVRLRGHVGGKPTLYAADDAHQCAARAAELMGLGSEAVRALPLDAGSGSLSIAALEAAVTADRAAGHQPFALIGTAGSVDAGRFDDLHALADVAAEHGLWLHVDGAFGAWTVIADEPWRSLARGLERADSLAFDFHKWPGVQYSAGAVLVRDQATLAAAFGGDAAYLQSDVDDALAGGAPWPCDLGPELSRGFLALKVWSALRLHGIDALGAAISDNCRQVAFMAALVDEAPELELIAPVISNVCRFRLLDPTDRAVGERGRDDARADERHRRLAADLQRSGEAVLSTTRVAGRLVLRAAIVNHRTTDQDVRATVDAVRREARAAT